MLGGVLWLGSALLARRITRPLAHLTRVAEDIGAGRYRARTPVHGNDELSHLARTVNDMAGRIEAQVEDQRTLLATVSHELRTPLGHLRILAELASDPDLPEPDRQHALLDIDGEVQEMDLLVGELLANSRLDFQSVSAQPMEPEVTARRALQRAGLQEVPLVVQADLPAVAADATLIARALSNLLRNAQVHGGGAQLLRVHRDLLHAAQHHDLDQAADMERRCGRIEADIARDHLLLRQGVQPRSIGLLVDIATLIEQAQEVGLEIGHGALLPWSAAVSMEGGQCKRIPYPITLPVRRRRFAP